MAPFPPLCFDQGAPHFVFALGSTNCGVIPAFLASEISFSNSVASNE